MENQHFGCHMIIKDISVSILQLKAAEVSGLLALDKIFSIHRLQGSE